MYTSFFLCTINHRGRKEKARGYGKYVQLLINYGFCNCKHAIFFVEQNARARDINEASATG
jgi:hypothetical protein